MICTMSSEIIKFKQYRFHSFFKLLNAADFICFDFWKFSLF